jgi:hypothetical protein
LCLVLRFSDIYLIIVIKIVADLYLAANLERYESSYGYEVDINLVLEKYPLVKLIYERVNNNQRLKAYKAKRPVTSF